MGSGLSLDPRKDREGRGEVRVWGSGRYNVVRSEGVVQGRGRVNGVLKEG